MTCEKGRRRCKEPSSSAPARAGLCRALAAVRRVIHRSHNDNPAWTSSRGDSGGHIQPGWQELRPPHQAAIGIGCNCPATAPDAAVLPAHPVDLVGIPGSLNRHRTDLLTGSRSGENKCQDHAPSLMCKACYRFVSASPFLCWGEHRNRSMGYKLFNESPCGS